MRNQLKINTEQFGAIEIDEDKIICMPAGMPGFLGQKRFVTIEREETWPFVVYQCVDDTELSFFIMNPYLFKADYEVNLDQAARDMKWAAEDHEHMKVYTIVNTTAGVPEKITANLLGPLIINVRKQEAHQLVMHNSPYSHKHPIFGDAGPEKTRDVDEKKAATG